MALIRIKEYINNTGKTIEKPQDSMDQKTQKNPDYPEKNQTHGKNYAFAAASNEKPLPYMANQIVVKQNDKLGLGDMGTPSVDFSISRKNIVDFSEYIEHCGCEKKKAPFVVAYSSGSFHPDPIQAIKYVVYLTNENNNILKALMHEAKNRGCLHKYMKYLSKYPEMQQIMQNQIN